jgi:adenine deaminase
MIYFKEILMDNPEITPWKTTRDAARLMNVALGKTPADLAVVNATLLNVYTGELLKNQSISVTDKWIAYVGENAQDAIGPETMVIDAAGKTVIPGLIDGHTHLGWMCTIDEYLRYIIPGGTTTIVTETLEPYPVGGLDAVQEFLASLEEQPIKFLATAPAMASISTQAGNMPIQDLKHLLSYANVLGLGESYWQNVLQQPDTLLPRFAETLRSGKILEGHSAGASEKKLNAYIAAGITSCHEPIKAEEVLQRLRLGIHVMAREGSIRRDLEEIAKIRMSHVDLRRLLLVTDGIHPNDLLDKGSMEYVVQRAIACGFDPVVAVQMATLNVAEHFSVDHWIGGIAPGRFADILVIPDITTIRPLTVISNGRVVFNNNTLSVPTRRHAFSNKSRNSIRLPRQFESVDFTLGTASQSTQVTVRAMELVTDLVTKEIHLTLPVRSGKINSDIDQDLQKVAAIDRTHYPGKTFVGLVKGFGLQSGAFASSSAWDTSDIIVIGTNDEDMALAVNRIHALQGGYALCDNGRVVAEVPMPIWGLISELPIKELVAQISSLKIALADRGVPFPDPLLTIITLTGAAIPFFRICEDGYVNLKDGSTHGLAIN